jgi:hypothetical protein
MCLCWYKMNWFVIFVHSVAKFPCHVMGCMLKFDSLLQYELHYNSSHRYYCNECSKQLPSPHLLDLHISETHDSFFLAQAQRKPMVSHVIQCHLSRIGLSVIWTAAAKCHTHICVTVMAGNEKWYCWDIVMSSYKPGTLRESVLYVQKEISYVCITAEMNRPMTFTQIFCHRH